LFRGAGATGLGGIPDARKLGHKQLIRPLIDTPRVTLETWATAHQLRWIEDESNQDLAFRRNYVRHRILPAIVEVYPGAVGLLARTSAQMAEQASLLNRLAEYDASACRDSESFLSVARLQQLPEAAVRNILRYSLTKAGVQIPAARRLVEFSAQLMTAQTDTEAFVRMGAVGVHLWRDRIWIDPTMDQPSPSTYDIQCGVVAWPDGDLEIVGSLVDAAGLHVAPLGHGHRFQPQGRCRDRLSELLREKGVPPWTRSRLPGLWNGDTLVWVACLGWSELATQRLLGSPLQIVWKPNRSAWL
jgi:tRNA(Ile)-lysidine synthase